ncbi:MAG: class I SAM-dependent methyltransferase [Bacteroidetes bacterium]|nr:class I SAM-dependent methyltransferase [Bacteroidota bacterium]
MDIKSSYNKWAEHYDTDENRTRDLEAKVLREVLGGLEFSSCLEPGCGTGKNTEFLITKADRILCADLSEQMLSAAVRKINSGNASFIIADINQSWDFTSDKFDLIVFSLVLEHVEDLCHIFRSAAEHTNEHGLVYVGELHPYKQYSGTKARFSSDEGEHVLKCFTHNISEYISAAVGSGFEIIKIGEFSDDDRNTIPGILNLLFRKK